MTLEEVLSAYSIGGDRCEIQVLSGGLINATWKVSCNRRKYIVQRINSGVFKTPNLIDNNLQLLSDYLERFPDYLFVSPLRNVENKTLTVGPDDNYYRVFPFVENSRTIDRVTSADEAFEAASQFGKFTFMLKDFDASQLKITIPDFHNITLRYEQFLTAVSAGNPGRIKQSEKLIREVKRYSGIIEEYERIKKNTSFIKRVTHHDTKISNVLFDKKGKGLCVIDLDTVMPGYFFSDVGDMMRTYLSPSTEEDTDFSKIVIRDDVYQAIAEGYLQHTNDILTKDEKQKFFYAGTFMIYMQALRFLTDFLNNDVYYGAKYADHNFYRASNQLVLLDGLTAKRSAF